MGKGGLSNLLMVGEDCIATPKHRSEDTSKSREYGAHMTEIGCTGVVDWDAIQELQHEWQNS